MYAKLVLRSARRSVGDYLIYLVTLTLCVGLFYAFLSISSRHYHPDIGAEFDLTFLSDGMKVAVCGVTLLLWFLIRYVNRYMLRQMCIRDRGSPTPAGPGPAKETPRRRES